MRMGRSGVRFCTPLPYLENIQDHLLYKLQHEKNRCRGKPPTAVSRGKGQNAKRQRSPEDLLAPAIGHEESWLAVAGDKRRTEGASRLAYGSPALVLPAESALFSEGGRLCALPHLQAGPPRSAVGVPTVWHTQTRPEGSGGGNEVLLRPSRP
jgi:hypothetical protein